MDPTCNYNDWFSFIGFTISAYCDLIQRKSTDTSRHYFSFVENTFRWDFYSASIFLPAWSASLSSLHLIWILLYGTWNALLIFFRILWTLSILILWLNLFILRSYKLNLLFFIQDQLSHLSQSVWERICKVDAVIIMSKGYIELECIIILWLPFLRWFFI